MRRTCVTIIMKRQMVASLKEFISIPEWRLMLLQINPCPRFISKLLQLSKEMRRFVWDFIVDRTKSGEWHIEFGRRLYTQFPVPPPLPNDTYFTDQPFFIRGNGEGWDANFYFVSKLLSTKGQGNTLAFLCFGTRPGKPTFGENKEYQYQNWQLRPYVKLTHILHWHFVARAFAAWNDIRILANSLACRQGHPIFPGDLDLCLK